MNKKFLAGVILIGAIFVLAYFLFFKETCVLTSPPDVYVCGSRLSNFINSFNKTDESSSVSPAQIPNTTENKKEIAWKTYTNGLYGFEFKYPGNLSLDVCGDTKSFIVIGKTCGASSLADFSLALYLAPESSHVMSDLIASYESTLKSAAGFKKTTLMVAGLEATELYADEKPAKFPDAYKTYVVFSKDTLNFITGGDDNSLVMGILSTFKFK